MRDGNVREANRNKSRQGKRRAGQTARVWIFGPETSGGSDGGGWWSRWTDRDARSQTNATINNREIELERNGEAADETHPIDLIDEWGLRQMVVVAQWLKGERSINAQCQQRRAQRDAKKAPSDVTRSRANDEFEHAN